MYIVYYQHHVLFRSMYYHFHYHIMRIIIIIIIIIIIHTQSHICTYLYILYAPYMHILVNYP